MDREKMVGRAVVAIAIMLPLTLTFLAGYSLGKRSAVSRTVEAATANDSRDAAEILPEQITISQGSPQEEDDVEEAKNEYVLYRKSMIPLGKNFNDMPDKHSEAAGQFGLKAIPLTREDFRAKGLVKIQDCRYYKVDELKYSIPYLTKGAAGELERIGKSFQNILKDNKLPLYKITVTSVLRTQEDIKKLRRSGNVNASSNSVHCFGCTFDISYVSFEKLDNGDKRLMDSYELKKVLAQIMLAEKNAGRVYVKYERKQPCFHTTARF